jgi:hypothetical protein
MTGHGDKESHAFTRFGLLEVDIATKNIVMSQYVLWAILFEIVAMNLKE